MSSKVTKRELESAIAKGEPVGPSDEDTPKPEVSAATLRDLLCDASQSKDGVDCLWLRRVRVTGHLDLQAQNIGLQILFQQCEIEGDIDLSKARATEIRLIECDLKGQLRADQLNLLWGLFLDGSTVSGGILLIGAKIEGQLSMNGATLTGGENKDGTMSPALYADGLDVAQGVFFRDQFSATGEVRLPSAKIGGQLSMHDATLVCGKVSNGAMGPALNAEGIEVTRSMFCRGQFSATGEVRLPGARIGGQLSMSGATLMGSENDDGTMSAALNADGAEVAQGVFCREQFSATGEVRLLGARIGGQLSMWGATLEGRKAADGTADALSIDRAVIAGGMICNGLSATGQVRISGAKIEGQLSMSGATLMGSENDDGTMSAALNADGVEVAQGMYCREQFSATGEVRLLGAKIEGQLSFEGATLNGRKGDDGTTDALSVDHGEVAGDLFCTALTSTGQVRLLDAKIEGQLSMNGATLTGSENDDGTMSAALNADGVEVAQGVYCNEMSATGEVRLLSARVGDQLSLEGAILVGRKSDDGTADALSIDRAKVAGDVYCNGLSSTGQVRLLDAKIGGQLSMNGATLMGSENDDGTISATLNADRVEVAQGVYCNEMSATGEVRLLSARVGGQLSMDGATLMAAKGGNGKVIAALGADGIQVTQDMFCRRGFSATGQVRLPSAKIGGQLSMDGATLTAGPDRGSGLVLLAATVDELIVAFKEVNGTIDLRDTNVRSLWDAQYGEFVGQLPESMRLEGFTYQSLREPLDAEHRLKWIAASQRERHYPGVYAELASAFRRIGYRNDARKVAIANERRARQDTSKWGLRRGWHDLLWITIGYGYKDWLAGVWLLGLMGVGSLLFALNESSFVEVVQNPPSFNPILYAVDVTIPVLDLGQTHARSATGFMAWVGLALAVSGYAFAAAVIAAAAGIFSRDQV